MWRGPLPQTELVTDDAPSASEVVAFPLLWGGLTSEPACSAARSTPAAGAYVLRGRLDSKISADVPLTIG